MITLSTGHSFEYVTASGALGFDGKGWWWEKPLIAAGLMKPELFTIVLRTLTLEPRPYPISNLSWVRPWTWLPWSPYSCVQFLPDGGVVSKVGLWNPGIDAWCDVIAPQIDFHSLRLVASISGTEDELVKMARILNRYIYLVAVELNVSCPNTGEKSPAEQIVESVKAVKEVSRRPLWLKLGVDQKASFREIADGVCGSVEAFALNSVPFKTAFPGRYESGSPVARIGKPGSGSGGISGKPAQEKNWEAVRLLALYGRGIPVIAPSIMDHSDLAKVRARGAQAVSFGAIHCRTPWKPTKIVEQDRLERNARRIRK